MATNPYNPLMPTEEPEYFFGRDDVFAFFRQHLVGTALDNALVLIGRRGLGKSSVLRQLGVQLDEQYVPCVVNLLAIELTSETALFTALSEAVHVAMEWAGASTYRLPDWPEPVDDDPPPDLRAWFRDDYLDVAIAALRVRHLLLVFDDAHLLLDAIDQGVLPVDWLSYLADLLTHYERLDMALALDATHESRVLGIDVTNNPVLHWRLAELDPEAAERLIREPVENIYEHQPGIVGSILELTGGHPYLIHSICRLLFRRAEERAFAGPITETDLNAVRIAALDQAYDIFGPLWQRATPNEQNTLLALVRLDATEPGEGFAFETIYGWLTGAGYAMNRTQLAAALRSLDYDGWIQADEDTYRLYPRLVADWVRANFVPAPIAAPPRAPLGWTQFGALAGLATVILLVAVLGAAVLLGIFGGDDDDGGEPLAPTGPTATLLLNLEATRQAEFAAQTDQARPSSTPRPTSTAVATRTLAPSATTLPTDTPARTPTSTATATVTVTPTVTATRTPPPTATRTATPTASPTERPMRTPRASRTPIRFAPTPTQGPLPTLAPF